MPSISVVQKWAIAIGVLSVLGLLVSVLFTPSFVEQHIDADGHIGEHVKIRITLFQDQVMNLSIVLGILGGLLFYFHKQMHSFLSKRREMVLGILVLLIVCGVMLLLGEIVLRLFFAEQIYKEYGAGPGGLRFMNSIELNSLGYRDSEHALQKNEEVTRILVIGDSFTFGTGIEKLEDIYPKVLEKKLNEAFPEKYEVISIAKSGYSTLDHVKALKEEGLQFQPDIIILGYYMNDAEGPGSREGYEKLFFHHYTYPYEIGSILYTHSFMYYFLESRLKNIQRALFPSEQTFEDYISHLYTNQNPFFSEHRSLMEEFINLGTSNDIPVLVMVIPIIGDFEEYPFAFINDYVQTITEENQATYVDLRPSLEGFSADQIRVSFMDSHLNEFGNEVAAETLVDAIDEWRNVNVKE